MKKTLVMKLSALGDLCLALPHLETILSHHAGEEVWILTSPAYAELFRYDPRVRLAVLDRRELVGPCGSLRRLLWIRRQRFSTLYDFQANRVCRRLARYSGAKRCVGIQPYPFYECHPPLTYTGETRQNFFDRLQETIASAGLPQSRKRATLFPGPEESERVSAWKRDHGLTDGNYVLFHAGSSRQWPSKQWPKEFYGALAMALEGHGLTPIWVGGSEDQSINHDLAIQAGLDATGLFTLPGLYFLGQGARFAVANDSGPMHLLALSGLPVFGFFGPTSWLRSHAVGQGERVLRRDEPCSPCFKKNCPPERGHACLRKISVETVLARIAAEGLLLHRQPLRCSAA